MFGFKKNNHDYALVTAERENLLSVLMSLLQFLKNSGNNAQSEFIYKLVKLINHNNFSDFIKLINGVNMWGGAGAVWEVHIENKDEANAFEKEMLRLIYLMEKTKIIGKGIMSIKKIFENNVQGFFR